MNPTLCTLGKQAAWSDDIARHILDPLLIVVMVQGWGTCWA